VVVAWVKRKWQKEEEEKRRKSQEEEEEKTRREWQEEQEEDEKRRKSQEEEEERRRLYQTSAGALLATGVLGYGAYKISTFMKEAKRVVNLADTNIVDILATVIHLKKLIPPDNKDLLYQTNDSIRQLQELIKATTVAKKYKKNTKKNKKKQAGSI